MRDTARYAVRALQVERIKRKLVGDEVKGVGVMKDEERKLEEIETSHTLGVNQSRRCRYYSVVRYTIVNRSLGIYFRKDKGLVVTKTMDMCV